MNSPPKKSGTDFQSPNQELDRDPAFETATPSPDDTSFQALDQHLAAAPKAFQHRSATDYLIDILTPIMIFVMVYAVIFFLLDVRFIYTEIHDGNMRMVAFFFILGMVALNRLIARDGSEESILYIAGLTGAIGLYTMATTALYDVGSVARGFLNHPLYAAAFNMTIVAFLWWITNRLMHECCLDENPEAGDVGMLTSTARKVQERVRSRSEDNAPKPKGRKDPIFETMEIAPIDPMAWTGPEKTRPLPPPKSASRRLAKRHPGMLVFYVSVPVYVIFALGLPVLMQGGRPWILAGHFYVGLYTISALSLLMLTSLGGLREYFRSRHVHFPAGIGWFWVGLGAFMIVLVTTLAVRLPQPSMPAMAYVGEHQTDFWTKGSTFELQSAAASTAVALDRSRFVQHTGNVVLVCLGAFLLYGALRGMGAFAAAAGRHRYRLPPFVGRFFDRLDALLLRILRVPALPGLGRRPRISRKIARSPHYHNPMKGEGLGSGADVKNFVAQSYEALCALAEDLGVPRRDDQTPYEFVETFPKPLRPIKEEALELTELYVQAAYSNQELDEKVLDRLRKFWSAYEKVRRAVIR